jgi:hypothetical protein
MDPRGERLAVFPDQEEERLPINVEILENDVLGTVPVGSQPSLHLIRWSSDQFATQPKKRRNLVQTMGPTSTPRTEQAIELVVIT